MPPIQEQRITHSKPRYLVSLILNLTRSTSTINLVSSVDASAEGTLAMENTEEIIGYRPQVLTVMLVNCTNRQLKVTLDQGLREYITAIQFQTLQYLKQQVLVYDCHAPPKLEMTR